VVLPVPDRRALRALQDPRSGLILSVAALVAAWLVVTHHGPFSGAKINDLYVYSQYRDILVHAHLTPYRDFPFEYPPGALVPILLAGGDATKLSWLMLGCAVVCQLCAWRVGGARAGWLIVLLPALAGALVRTHFDLLPAALSMLGLLLLVAPPRRLPHAAELGFAVLALGTVAKLWPAALALVAFAWLLGRRERAAAWRGGAVFAAVVLACCVPFALHGGFPRAMVEFHLHRPVQIESTAATAIEVAGGSYVTGDPIRHDDFKSNGLDGGAADAFGIASTVLLLAAAAALTVLTARRPSRDALVVSSLAIVLAFVAFGKVLSPQYLCWLLPLAAVAAARGAPLGAALTGVAALLTQLWFPDHYFDVVTQHAWAVVAVGARNVILLLALAATARALARSPSRAAAAPRSG
jgi:hypothetical protein